MKAEEMMSSMNEDRRRQSLQNYLLFLQQDIERELKGKEGQCKLRPEQELFFSSFIPSVLVWNI